MSIQERRKKQGWTQELLAQHSGLSVRTIQRLESGEAATLESLKCLAAVFETTVSELIEEQQMTTKTDKTQQNAFTAELEKEAISYVQNLKGFHMNWIAFLFVIPALFALNLYVSPGRLWVLTVAAAWLFAIGLHALVIFGLFHVFGGKWEQREFQKRMQRYHSN